MEKKNQIIINLSKVISLDVDFRNNKIKEVFINFINFKIKWQF